MVHFTSPVDYPHLYGWPTVFEVSEARHSVLTNSFETVLRIRFLFSFRQSLFPYVFGIFLRTIGQQELKLFLMTILRFE